MHMMTGTWDLTVHSIVGDLKSILEVTVEGDSLLGKQTDCNSGNATIITDGKVNGDDFTYNATLKLPMGNITFIMEGTINDKVEMKGVSKNPMGDSDFEGSKR